MVFDAATLGLPMVNRNPRLLSALLPGLELAIERDDSGRTLADDVRLAVSETMCGGRPAVAHVAKSMGMSPRTLQRRLGELGATYQNILDDVRHRAARRLLASTDHGMGEIAFLLGFEEVNSFMRAFHTWEGTTPARWRDSPSKRGGDAEKNRTRRVRRASRSRPPRS
jgi:AraC-like DNA-binding protein